MDILNINIKDYIPDVIEVYTEIFGEEYRKLIEERINSGEIITYFTEGSVREYRHFLENCKVQELSIKFLKEIGIDVSSLEGKSYAEELPARFKELIVKYIGGYNAFYYNPEENFLGIMSFDKDVKEKSGRNENQIIEEQMNFLNFFLGEERFFYKEDLEEFYKTDEFREINSKIQDYIKTYKRLVEEYEDYKTIVEKQTEFGENEEKKEFDAILPILESVRKDKENENDKEILNEIFKEKKLMVAINGVNKPILFYTINGSGMLDYSMLHEYCHLIETIVEDGKCKGSAFDNDEEKNLYREEKRKYERLNENLTDIFAIEGTRILHAKGRYMLEPKELTRNNIWNINTNSITKKMLIPFLRNYKKEIIRARMTGDMERLFDIIGKDNFQELNDCINRVDYLAMEGLEKSLRNKKCDELVEEYNGQLERLDKIYSNMKEHFLEDETR